jgi:hypothetical protein
VGWAKQHGSIGFWRDLSMPDSGWQISKDDSDASLEVKYKLKGFRINHYPMHLLRKGIYRKRDWVQCKCRLFSAAP